MTKKDETKKADAPAPNIAFIGERFQRSPLKTIRDGSTRISLPEADKQKKAFYHKDAARVVALFPRLYKIVRPKAK